MQKNHSAEREKGKKNFETTKNKEISRTLWINVGQKCDPTKKLNKCSKNYEKELKSA